MELFSLFAYEDIEQTTPERNIAYAILKITLLLFVTKLDSIDLKTL